MAKWFSIKGPGRSGQFNSLLHAVTMKYFNLLFSLWLAFLLCSSWVSAFSSLATPNPTPPTGAPVEGNTGTGFPGPPMADTTNATPDVSTIYPIYG